jgi:AraC family transcriptional regulator
MRSNTENQFSSFYDYAQRGYFEDCIVENRLVGSQGVSVAKVVQSTGDFSDPPLPDLHIVYKKAGFCRGIVNSGGGLFGANSVTRGFTIIPPEVATTVILEGSYELYTVAIPGQWSRSLLEPYRVEKTLDFGKLHRGLQEDKTVFRLVEQLHHKETLESNNALLVDGLVMALLGRLATLADRYAKPRPIRSLDKGLLVQVEDFLQEDLAANPTTQDLADITGMSIDHFGRCFKQSTGQTPHQYVLAKRLERVKQLLEDSQLSLVEVALTVGFASQAHMNKMFKQHFAMTPGTYRKHLES